MGGWEGRLVGGDGQAEVRDRDGQRGGRGGRGRAGTGGRACAQPEAIRCACASACGMIPSGYCSHHDALFFLAPTACPYPRNGHAVGIKKM